MFPWKVAEKLQCFYPMPAGKDAPFLLVFVALLGGLC
jgi:hypothetical protein